MSKSASRTCWSRLHNDRDLLWLYTLLYKWQVEVWNTNGRVIDQIVVDRSPKECSYRMRCVAMQLQRIQYVKNLYSSLGVSDSWCRPTLVTVDVQLRNFVSPEFGTKFHGELPLFLKIPKFLYITAEGSFCTKIQIYLFSHFDRKCSMSCSAKIHSRFVCRKGTRSLGHKCCGCYCTAIIVFWHIY